MSMQVTDTLSYIQTSNTRINLQGFGPNLLEQQQQSSTRTEQQQQQQQQYSSSSNYVQHLQTENFFERMTKNEKRLSILVGVFAILTIIFIITTIIFASKYSHCKK